VSPSKRTGTPRSASDAGKPAGRRRAPAQAAGPRRAAAPARSRPAGPTTRPRRGTEAPPGGATRPRRSTDPTRGPGGEAAPGSSARRQRRTEAPATSPNRRQRGREAPTASPNRRPQRGAGVPAGSSTQRGRGAGAAGAGASSTRRGRGAGAGGAGASATRRARGTGPTGGPTTRPRRGAAANPRPRAAGGGRAEPAGGGAAEQADGAQLLRLNKALSGAGLGSRRAVEELVRAGRVSVDGEVVQDLGRRVDPARDRVEVDGSRVVLDERRRYWLLNKPAGVITTAADPSGRPTVVGMVPDQPRVFPVGRLDRDTEGLLLLTNDGPLAYRLTHARYGVEKRYLAEVERLPAAAPTQLRQGVELEDGLAKPVRVRVVAGSGRRRMIEVGLVEGRNREVRRLLDAVGAPVRRLVRTAVGPIRLTGLAPGEFRALRPEEVRSLYQAVGL
jgi:23S rRNA pseudouridine2605 synthase